MNGILIVVMVFLLLAVGLGVVAYLVYQRKLRRAKAIERGLKMVPIQIHLPPPSADTVAGSRDVRDVIREKTAQAEVLYNLLAGTASEGFKSKFYGQRHIALEIVASHGLVHFYAAVPVAMVSVVEKAIQTAYPGSRLEEVEDHNIFNQEGRLAATMGGEIILKADSSYPISTYQELDRDPLEAIITTLSSMGKDDGAAIQVMVRPAGPGWVKQSTSLVEHLRKGKSKGMGFNAMDVARAVVAPPTTAAADAAKQAPSQSLTNLQLGTIERIENKTKQPGFEVLVRLVVSTQSVASSQQLLRDLATAFALFEAPGLNGFKFLPAVDVQGLVTAFILRFFPPEMHSSILNSTELATLFHLPDSQFVPTANVERQASKEVDGPVSLPSSGLLFGYNEFRGVKKEIRLSTEDRRRHTYILGQTGTGKSTVLENLAVQDMLAGNGFAFIDPHGDSAEKLLSMVPKSRAEDVIYFNPSDTEYPLGLNLFEFKDDAQKDFIIQETIGMLYKLYDPGHTGIIGPRYEHWYRNAALTLMSDPGGATFIEIPKVFTDTEYLKQKFRYLKDPTVIDFWTKEMGQTSDYHKSEMLGWFVSKFGAFQNNEMMRNIIGQTKSSFNIREIMDNKKILIVNLSKGRIGELNSQLLGMIFVIKFQAAAMNRADMPEADRTDFALYVDEFQNFSTDSFASILSEARKYRLNLIVANQYVGQLSDEIRDAVFGNIGTIMAHRTGPEDAEFMTKQFAPVFDARDLVNIPNFRSAMRLMIGGLPSQPFTVSDLPPLGNANAELGLAIKQLSAAKFGASKSAVEADISSRLSARPAPAAVPAPVEPDPVSVPLAQAPALSIPAVMPPAPTELPAAELYPAVPAAITAQPQVPVYDTVASVPAAPIMSLPPIGAPPVDSISAPAMVPFAPIIAEPEPVDNPAGALVVEPAAVPAPGGLSITDIMGGRKLPEPTASSAPAYIPPIGSPPMDLPFVPSPVQPMPQVAGGLSSVTPPESLSQAIPSGAAEALSDIPLIPAGAEPKPPAIVKPEVSDQPVETTTRTRVIELADRPLADDPMATIPLIEDLRPISVVETAVVVPQAAPEAPAADVASPADLQATAAAELLAIPAETWVKTAEPEPSVVVPSELDEEVDFSGSLVHFTDPKVSSILEESLTSMTPDVVAADKAPEVPIVPEVPAIPVILPPTEPVAVPAPIQTPELVTPLPPAGELVLTTLPPIGAPPIEIPVPAVRITDPEALTPAPEEPVPVPEIVIEPAGPALQPVSDAAPAPMADITEVPKTEVEPPIPDAAPSVELTADVATKPEDEATPDPERSSEDILAAVMEAARLRQAEREAVPAEASAPVPGVAETAPESEPLPQPDAAVNPDPVPPIESPAEFTPEILDNLPVIDPVLAAEDQIDDLLNTSIIHDSQPSSSSLPVPDEISTPPDDVKKDIEEVVTSETADHHRLPDAVSTASEDDDSAPEEDDRGYGLAGGHKVIQPLEPIVSHQEEFAQELEKLEVEEQTAVPVIQAEVALQPSPALTPVDSPETEIIAASAAGPVVMPEDDFGLPEAESLDAGVVAAARAKREADEIAAQVQARVELVTEAPVKTDMTDPESAKEEEVVEKPTHSKRKRMRNRSKTVHEGRNNDAPQDYSKVAAPPPDSPADNPPPEPKEDDDSQTGKLIMPSSDTTPNHGAPPTISAPAKPDKLAKGEVFVDAQGNVIVGE